jgi:hypothetical protein
MEIIDKHICKTCNKEYSSYSSLWNHHKNIHKSDIENIPKNSNINPKNSNIIHNYNCRYCEKTYDKVKTRWAHEQKCKIIFEEKEQEKQINEIKIAEINKEIKLADIKLAEINSNEKIKLAEINKEIELKKLEIRKENSIIKQKSYSNPTIKKINKMLQNKINMINSNLNSNNTTNNIVHNHFKIEGFGKENILDVITEKEKKLIINQGCNSIEKFVEITYTGKYDQFKNAIVTNKRDNEAYVYDEKVGLFISCDKKVVLKKLVENSVSNIEEIYNDFDENNKLNDNIKKVFLHFFIKFIDENKIYIDDNNKEFNNYTEYKINILNKFLFNNKDKIMDNIAIAIEK